MFICEKCLEKYEEVIHLSGSYGPCELCGKTASCADIHGALKLKKKNKKGAKK